MSHPLHAIDQGTGSVLLLLHGFPLDHTMWRNQTETLATKFRVVAPDLRGFGKSSIEPIAAKTGIAIADYADDVAAVLDNLGVREPVVVCGLSMGGYVAWQFFERHRDRVRALVQCDTKSVADTPKARETRYQMAESVEGWGAAHVATLMAPKMLAATTLSSNTKLVDEVTDIISRTDPVAIAAAQRGMAHRDDKSELLGAIDVPTLYMVGEEDAISPPAEMRAMADATPDAEYVEIPNSGHLSPMENPHAVNHAIDDFIARRL